MANKPAIITTLGYDGDLKFVDTLNQNLNNLRDKDVGNYNELKGYIDGNETDIENKLAMHKTSTDHPADKITYTGKVTGAANAKQAIDSLQSQVDEITSEGSIDPEVSQAHVDVEGNTFDTLKAVNDAWQMRTKALENEVNAPDYSTPETKTAPVFSLSNAALETPFKQFDVKARTYTNLLVNYGDFETDSDGDGLADGWVRGWRGNYYGTSLDTAQSVSGKVCQRITPNVGGTSTGILDIYFSVNTIAGKYYFVSGYAQGGKVLIQVGTYYMSGEYYTAVDQRNENWVRHGVKVLGTGDPIYITLGTNATEAAIFDAWMVNEIEDEYSDLSIDELMQRYPYVNGTKGTGPLEIKSVGKNLVKNGNGEYGLEGLSFQNGGGNITWDTQNKSYKITWGVSGQHLHMPLSGLKPNTTYSIKTKIEGWASVSRIMLDTYNSPISKGSLSSQPSPISSAIMPLTLKDGYATATVTTPSNIGAYHYLHFNFFDVANYGTIQLKEISVTEGATPLTTYEPYKESITYTPALSDNQIYSVEGLTSYPSGTISFAPKIRFTAKPKNGVINVPEEWQEWGIKAIASLKKVVDGIPSEDATVSSFTDTTITPDNVDNDAMYEIVYDYGSENTTIPEITYSYAINRAAQADQTAKGLNDVTKRVSSIEDILSVLIVMSN